MTEDSRDNRSAKPEKFIGYFRLVDSCAEPGCPICLVVTQVSRHSLTALLYEQVTDPDTRRRLRASWGFCNWHAWMLLEIEDAFSGAAIIYEDIVGTLIDRVRRLLTRSSGSRRRVPSLPPWLGGRSETSPAQQLYRRREVCPVCALAADAENGALETMIRFVDEPDFQLAYARSDGLCVPHALRALEIAGGSSQARELVKRTLPKWAKLREDLATGVRDAERSGACVRQRRARPGRVGAAPPAAPGSGHRTVEPARREPGRATGRSRVKRR